MIRYVCYFKAHFLKMGKNNSNFDLSSLLKNYIWVSAEPSLISCRLRVKDFLLLEGENHTEQEAHLHGVNLLHYSNMQAAHARI
jgi:hypothetical protein